MATTRYRSSGSPFCEHFFLETLSSRASKRIGCVKVSVKKPELSESNAKKANLSARKKERVKLPKYGDGIEGNGICRISDFFNHPSGIEAILNTRALQNYKSLASNLYRCVLPQIQLFSFRVAPVLDLRITPTSEDCVVEMLSCKFEGSEVAERQNEHFSASMRNRIKWESINAEQFLDVDVKLNVNLEIYTPPFTLLPTSAVEGPGNIVMQALVDQMVPLLVQQLMQDYEQWIDQQSKQIQ